MSGASVETVSIVGYGGVVHRVWGRHLGHAFDDFISAIRVVTLAHDASTDASR